MAGAGHLTFVLRRGEVAEMTFRCVRTTNPDERYIEDDDKEEVPYLVPRLD